MTAKQIAAAGVLSTIILAVAGAFLAWMLRVTEDTSTTRTTLDAVKDDVKEIKDTIRAIAPPTIARQPRDVTER